MRYKEIIMEKIAKPPRNLQNYLTVRLKKLEALKAQLEHLAPVIEQADRAGGESTLARWLRYSGAENAYDLSRELYMVCHLATSFDRYIPLERTHGNSKHTLEFNSTNGPGPNMSPPIRRMASLN